MILARPLTHLEDLVWAALQRQGPAVGDAALRQLVVDWARDLRSKGWTHGEIEGTIAGVMWPMSCRLSKVVEGAEYATIDLRRELAFWITEAIGAVGSRLRAKH